MLVIDMDELKSSQIKVSENAPTGIVSRVYGGNVDALAFNVGFIAHKNPKLAVEVMGLYDEARKISETDPPAPDEDYALFVKRLSELSGQDLGN